MRLLQNISQWNVQALSYSDWPLIGHSCYVLASNTKLHILPYMKITPLCASMYIYFYVLIVHKSTWFCTSLRSLLLQYVHMFIYSSNKNKITIQVTSPLFQQNKDDNSLYLPNCLLTNCLFTAYVIWIYDMNLYVLNYILTICLLMC